MARRETPDNRGNEKEKIIANNDDYHEVVRGNSMYQIAKKYDIPMDVLIFYNEQIGNKKKKWGIIHIGDKIGLPSEENVLLISSILGHKESINIGVKTEIASYKKSIFEEKITQIKDLLDSIGDITKNYKIKSGDNLYKIASDLIKSISGTINSEKELNSLINTYSKVIIKLNNSINSLIEGKDYTIEEGNTIKIPVIKTELDEPLSSKSIHNQTEKMRTLLSNLDILKESLKLLLDRSEANIVSYDIFTLSNGLEEDIKKHIINPGDKLNTIAKNENVELEDLLRINVIFGLVSKKDRYKIYPGSTLYIPNKENLDTIKYIYRLREKLKTVKQLDSATYDAKQIEIITQRIFPSKQIPVGFTKLLDGFVKAQETKFDPDSPRIVDINWQKDMGCSNMLRALMRFATKGHGSEEEQVYKDEQNIDAWELPGELKKIGFKQEFSEFMDYFEPSKFNTREPIKNKEEYNALVIKLGEYLQNNPNKLKGSLLPFYFNLSRYKRHVRNFNKKLSKENRHLNTHVTFFAGEGKMKFEASNVNLIKNGKKFDFGLSLESLEEKINSLTKEKEYIENTNKGILKTRNSDRFLNEAYTENILRIAYLDKKIGALKDKKQKILDEQKQIKLNIETLDSKRVILETSLDKSETELYDYKLSLQNTVSDLNLSLENFPTLKRKYNLIHKYVNGYGFFKMDGNVIPGIEEPFIELIEQSSSHLDLANKLKSIKPKEGDIKSKLFHQLGLKYFKISRYKTDVIFFFNLIRNRKNIENGLNKLNTFLIENPDKPIKSSDLRYLLSIDKKLIERIKEYNSQLKSTHGIIKSINKNKKEKDELEMTLDTSGKKQNISVIDFIANFIQLRQDFGGSFSNSQKQKIISSFSAFGSLIHIKLNGEPIDILKQYELYKSKKGKSLQINNDDIVEINGPMLMDGEHKYNSEDINKKNNLNSRTRFFFEFIVAGNYLPTELITPQENSIFKKEKFDTLLDQLQIDQLYDLRPGEFLYNKLKMIITEKEGLDPNASNYESEVRRFYALQIKALKIYGYLESENKINEGSFLINSPIPYFNSENINEVYKQYNAKRKKELLEINKQNAEKTNYIEVKVFSGDTKRNIFHQVKELLKPHQTKENYKNLNYLENLDEYSVELFMSKLLKDNFFTRKSNKPRTWNNLKEGESIILSLKVLDKIIKEVVSNSQIEDNSFFADAINKKELGHMFSPKYFELLPLFMFSETGYPKGDRLVKRKRIKDIGKILGKVSSTGPYQLKFAYIEDKWIEEIIQGLSLKEKTNDELFAIIFPSIYSKKPTSMAEVADRKGKKYYIDKLGKAIKEGNINEIKPIFEDLISKIDINKPQTIGNYINNYLMLKKLESHDKNLSYLLFDSLKYDTSKIDVNEYNAGLFTINNLGEGKAYKAMFDNYIRRLVISTGGSQELGKEFDLGDKVDLKEIDKYSFKEYISSKIIYTDEMFIKNISKYVSLLEGKVDTKIIDALNKIVKKGNVSNNDRIKVVSLLQESGINGAFLPTVDEVKEHYIFNTAKKYYKLKNTNLTEMKIAF